MFLVAIQCLALSNTVALECFPSGLLAFSEEEEEEEKEEEGEREEPGRGGRGGAGSSVRYHRAVFVFAKCLSR